MKLAKITAAAMAGVAAATILSAFTAPPASAAARPRGSIRIDHNDRKIEVCDLRADGRGMSVGYYSNDGRYHRLGDGNGSKPGCGNRWVSQGIYKAYGPDGKRVYGYSVYY